MYLRSDIQAEPLIDSWYAWTYLIPPATRARNTMERHIPIMESYIAAPSVHASAVRNPKMLGGPFIDYKGARVEEIASLLRGTISKHPRLIELSRALSELDQLLQTGARGDSLHNVYPRVPHALRGFVELFYDLHNNPNYRILEPLMYNSWRGVEAEQTVMLSLTSGDDRPFVLSTPRLPGDGLLELKVDFSSHALDRLFASTRNPAQFHELAELCGVGSESEALFRSFFVSKPPPNYVRYSGPGVRWRYFGHACILLETARQSFLFDPVLSYTYESSVSRYTYDDLPDHIDYVFITHNHQDHVLLESLLQLRHKIGTIIVPRNAGGTIEDPSLRLILREMGFLRVSEVSELDTLDLGDVKVTALPFLGEHSDLNVQSKMAYLLDIKGHKLFFAADSCNIEPRLYDILREIIGEVRAIFLGMECDGAPGSWLYGPLYNKRLERQHDQSRRLNGSNYDQAISIVDILKCREVFVYAMGQEPWLNHVMSIKYTADSNPIVHSNRLLSVCRERDIVAERLFGEREMMLD